MLARSEIVIDVGMILIEIQTGALWRIVSRTRPMPTRNSGGHTTKKSRKFCLQKLNSKEILYWKGRGEILNRFRVPESAAEQVLYGTTKE